MTSTRIVADAALITATSEIEDRLDALRTRLAAATSPALVKVYSRRVAETELELAGARALLAE